MTEAAEQTTKTAVRKMKAVLKCACWGGFAAAAAVAGSNHKTVLFD